MEKRQQYREQNIESIFERKKNYIDNNIDSIKEYHNKYYNDNKDFLSKQKKLYYRDNKESILKRQKQYYQNNKDVFYSRASKRRSNKLQRSLPLSKQHQEEMDHIYEQASLLRYLGYDVHVDHVVPLQGSAVSGLHVPWNLQIISAEENLSKNNNFEPYTEIYVLNK